MRSKPSLRLNLGDIDNTARVAATIKVAPGAEFDEELSQFRANRVNNYKGYLRDSLNCIYQFLVRNAAYRTQNIHRGHQPLPSRRVQNLLNALSRLHIGEEDQNTASPDETDEPDCYFSQAGGWESFVTPDPAPTPPAPIPAPAAAQNDNLVDSGSSFTGWIATPDLMRVKRPNNISSSESSSTDSGSFFDWHREVNRGYELLAKDNYRVMQIHERNELLLRRQSPRERSERIARFADFFSSMQREDALLLEVEDDMRVSEPGVVIVDAYQEFRLRSARKKLERASAERRRREHWARGFPDMFDLTTESVWLGFLWAA